MPLYTEVGLGPGHNVLDGDPAPPPQRGTASLFSAHICCVQMAGWIKMTISREVGLSSPPPKGDGAPKFSAHICCGQMAGWIKMPLGRELGLSPSDIVLDADAAPLL